MIEAMIVDAPLRDATFAANRAMGRIALSVTAASGQSRRARVHEAGSLRVRFPNPADAAQLEAVIVNTAGGMAGGDRFDIEVDVGAGARLCLTSAAAEKIYRSLGPGYAGRREACRWSRARRSPGCRRRRFCSIGRGCAARSISISPSDASVLLAEAIVFGRSAMGETVACGHLFDRWRVRVGGELVFAETTRLDGEIAQRLSEAAVAAEARRSPACSSFPATKTPPRRSAPCSRALLARLASRAGMDLRSRAWSRPTAPPCATISSRC